MTYTVVAELVGSTLLIPKPATEHDTEPPSTYHPYSLSYQI
jgi:hypothetical protein